MWSKIPRLLSLTTSLALVVTVLILYQRYDGSMGDSFIKNSTSLVYTDTVMKLNSILVNSQKNRIKGVRVSV